MGSLSLTGVVVGDTISDSAGVAMAFADTAETVCAGTMETLGRTYGVAGEALERSLSSDNILTLLMLLGFVAIATAFGLMQRFVSHQARTFFRVPRNDLGRALLSALELRLQLALVAHTCMQAAVLLYLCNLNWIAVDGRFFSSHVFTLIFFGVMVGYFVGRALLYTLVDGVFFDGREHKEWMHSMLFISAAEGVFLFPVSLASIYLELSPSTIAIVTLGVVAVVKLLTFCKLFVIFFRPLGGYLQFFLYLCTLEIVPLLLLWAGTESVNFIFGISI